MELSRDLRIALSEYAPSSQIVAGGKLWTSRYIKKYPDRGWKRYTYAVCDHCQRYQRKLAELDEKIEECESCGLPIQGRNQGDFIIPQFGFITDNSPPGKPGDSRPERTYTTRTYFSGISKVIEQLSVTLNGSNITIIPAVDGELAIINHAGYRGFNICFSCGYTTLVGEDKSLESHQTPWRTKCSSRQSPHRLFLGHEYKTDIVQIVFDGYANGDIGFWYSLLYAILEGVSQTLEIDRQDIDGVLYPHTGNLSMPAIILIDDVPGGAGHVRRIAENKQNLVDVLNASLIKLERCNCGGEEMNTSCYGCLRNYRNQFIHDELRRGPVINFLKSLLR